MKHPIDPARMRKAPPRGFGWIDHRLLRDGHIGRASVEALALYLLLACASDAQGLSFYSDGRTAQLLGMEASAVARARRELIGLGLVLYCRPVYQLLSLEHAAAWREPESRNPLPLASTPRSPSASCPEVPQAAAASPGRFALRAAVEALLQGRGGAA